MWLGLSVIPGVFKRFSYSVNRPSTYLLFIGIARAEDSASASHTEHRGYDGIDISSLQLLFCRCWSGDDLLITLIYDCPMYNVGNTVVSTPFPNKESNVFYSP